MWLLSSVIWTMVFIFVMTKCGSVLFLQICWLQKGYKLVDRCVAHRRRSIQNPTWTSWRQNAPQSSFSSQGISSWPSIDMYGTKMHWYSSIYSEKLLNTVNSWKWSWGWRRCDWWTLPSWRNSTATSELSEFLQTWKEFLLLLTKKP